MSGIFGYVGKGDCKQRIVQGLKSLSYRGAEMSGAAFRIGDDILSVKVRGGAENLSEKIVTDADCHTALAQTCDANRTKASNLMAPPSANNLFAVCMDGIISNFDVLKNRCNNPFPILTDEDLFLAMLCIGDERDRLALLKKVISVTDSRPTVAFVAADEEAIYCHAGVMPLVIGIADDGVVLSSDIASLIGIAKKYAVLSTGDFARLTKDKVTVVDSKGKKAKRTLLPCPNEAYAESDYELRDEIYHCPLVAKETYNALTKGDKINFEYIKLSKRYVGSLKRVIITADRDSCCAAGSAAENFKRMTDVPVYFSDCDSVADCDCIVDKNTLIVAVSHRGESVEILSALGYAHSCGARIVLITGNRLSAAARIADDVINTKCDFGREKLSLRSFFAEYISLCFFGLYFGKKCDVVSDLYQNVALKMAEMMPGKIASALKICPQFPTVSKNMASSERLIFTGYGIDYFLAREAAEKFGTAAGFDTVAEKLNYIEKQYIFDSKKNTLVIAMLTDRDKIQKSLFFLRRLKAIGADILIFTTANGEQEINDFDNLISFNDSVPLFDPLSVVAGCYKMAVAIAEEKSKTAEIQPDQSA